MMSGSSRRPTDGLMRLAIAMFAVVGVMAKRSTVTKAHGALPKSDEDGPQPSLDPPTAPAVEHAPGLSGIAKAVFNRFGNDNISLVAAGIAFYILAAIFPALAALVSIYGLFADPNQVATQISGLGSMLPPEALKIITDGLSGPVAKFFTR